MLRKSSIGILAAFLFFFTACKQKQDVAADTGTIPSRIFEGGGGKIHIDLTINRPGFLRCSFIRKKDETVSAQRLLETGKHTFDLEIPEETYGSFELGIPDAKEGDSLKWEIYLDKQLVADEIDTLSHPLRKGNPSISRCSSPISMKSGIPFSRLRMKTKTDLDF